MATDEELAVRIIGANGPVAELEPDMLVPSPVMQLVVAIRTRNAMYTVLACLIAALPADLYGRLMTPHNCTAHGRDCVGIPVCFTSFLLLVLYQCAAGEKKDAPSRYESIWCSRQSLYVCLVWTVLFDKPTSIPSVFSS